MTSWPSATDSYGPLPASSFKLLLLVFSVAQVRLELLLKLLVSGTGSRWPGLVLGALHQ